MKYVKIHSVCEFCAKKGYLNEMYVRKEIKIRLKRVFFRHYQTCLNIIVIPELDSGIFLRHSCDNSRGNLLPPGTHKPCQSAI